MADNKIKIGSKLVDLGSKSTATSLCLNGLKPLGVLLKSSSGTPACTVQVSVDGTTFFNFSTTLSFSTSTTERYFTFTKDSFDGIDYIQFTPATSMTIKVLIGA